MKSHELHPTLSLQKKYRFQQNSDEIFVKIKTADSYAELIIGPDFKVRGIWDF